MKQRKSVATQIITWKQPKFGVVRYELRDGKNLIGELYWTKWLSDRAIAHYKDSSWELDRVGCLRQQVLVSDLRSGRQAASFEFGWLGEGDIHLANGRVYRWYRTKALSSAWAIVDEQDRLVYELQIGSRWFKHEASVSLAVNRRYPQLDLLVCLGLYLGNCDMQDAAAAVAATASIAAVI